MNETNVKVNFYNQMFEQQQAIQYSKFHYMFHKYITECLTDKITEYFTENLTGF